MNFVPFAGWERGPADAFIDVAHFPIIPEEKPSIEKSDSVESDLSIFTLVSDDE